MGKPVVPNNYTHLRRWALKRFGAQVPRLRWVIRQYAESAEAMERHDRKVPTLSYAFLDGQGRGLLRRRMNSEK
jgi:hypothetical protein